MKNYVYKIEKEIQKTLFENEKDEINSTKSVFIQIFCGDTQEQFESVIAFVKQEFPHAVILSSSTDGEIVNDKVTLKSTVVSISVFHQTDINSCYVQEGDSFEQGKKIAKQLVDEKTKLIVAFADGLLCNGEEFLDGIYSVAPHVIVSGGLSGDNAKFQRCFVGLDEKLYTQGIAAVALSSDTLHVKTLYNFGWQGIGVKHIITKSDKNRVYKIDDLTAVEFYTKFLGEKISAKLPSIGVEFPLVIEKENVKIARAVLAKYPDGSLGFAGNLLEGTEVYIGVGNIRQITMNPIVEKNINVEAFYIYSCMARRRFIPHLIEKELSPFTTLAPTSGFFTYGEFYTDAKPELLNQTLTAVALSESNTQKSVEHESVIMQDEDVTQQALTNILNETTKELSKETKRIENIKKELDAKDETLSLVQKMAKLGSWELDLVSGKIHWSDESFEIYKRDPALGSPTKEEFLEMVIPEDRYIVLNAERNLQDLESQAIEIRIKRGDGKIINIFDSAKLVMENNKPSKILGVTLDITELRMKDNIISQQSKLAQMGEMMNMIAHQWRQPLNAVSAASIKLSMQDQMNLITSEKIQETTDFISEMMQEMSQTINDFMNFAKPTDEKELVVFQTIIDDIMRLMNAQLKNHNILFVQDIEEGLSLLTYRKDLEHVLINLFSNARDAFEGKDIENKMIKVTAYSQGNDCIIKVADNAGGMPQNVMDRIFEPYFTTKEQGKGTGLGLYMSEKILKNTLNADISVTNKNNGAEFSIHVKNYKVSQ